MTINLTETKGSFLLEENNKILAKMTFSISSVSLIIIDHTEVDPSLRGTGTGKKLLMEIVQKARAENIKIIALCPFVKSVFDKDESIRDVLK